MLRFPIKNKKYQTLIIGSTSDYSRVWTWPVIQGSDFTDEDVKGLKKCGTYWSVRGRTNFLEMKILSENTYWLKGLPVQIVGVLSERGTSPSGDRLDDRIVIPITTLMRKLQNETKYVSALQNTIC